MRPESRREQLLAQSVGDELVIYDERTHEAHHLSPTAAQVWRHADGERDVADLASALRLSIAAAPGEEVPLPDDAESLELVRLALVELDRAGLLARAVPDLAVFAEPMSRRQMLGVTAALVPIVRPSSRRRRPWRRALALRAPRTSIRAISPPQEAP